MFPSEDTNLAWGWKEDEAKLHRHRHEPAASLGTLASYRMALCVARCPEWQTSPLAYLDGLLAICSDKITQSWPGYRTVARIQLSLVTPTAVLNVQVGRFAKRFTSICCGLPGIT